MIKILDYRIDPKEVVAYRFRNDMKDLYVWLKPFSFMNHFLINCSMDDFESFERQFEEAR